jgi:hypothetical protein
MSDKDKKPSKTPLQKYKAAHADKPLFYLGKKQDIKEESLEDMGEMTDHVWEVLAQSNKATPRFFLSQNRPAYLNITQHVDIQPLTPQTLKSLLNDVVYFYFCAKRIDDDGNTKTEYKTRTAPNFFLGQMLNNPLYAYPLPELERIVYAPYFTDNFHLHQTPGYDAASKTYYHLKDRRLNDLHIPAKPTPEQVAAAKKLILKDVLVDFPFSGEAELANALATMLEPPIRSWFDVTPFRLVESARSRTGKGLLTDALLYPFLGEMPTRSQEPPNPEEWQKLLMSILLAVPTVVFFDNIKKPVNNGSLESILTDKYWSRRTLGSHQQPRLVNQATWVFAGNNVQMGEEIANRTVRIRMVAKTARPNQRKIYVHNPLREWLVAHRKEIVEAILILIQHWIAKGRPVFQDAPIIGGYEKWCHVLHGILTVNEIPGFMGNLQDMFEMDKYDWDDITELIQELWLLKHAEVFSTNDVLLLIQAQEHIPVNLGSGNARAQSTTLGCTLSRNRERVFLVDEAVLKADLPVTITREVQFLISGSKQHAKLWRLHVLSEHWRAKLNTQEQAATLYNIHAAECELALQNQAVIPEEPEIEVTQAEEKTAEGDNPF